MHQVSVRGRPSLTQSLFCPWCLAWAGRPRRPPGKGGCLSPTALPPLSPVPTPHWCLSSFSLKKKSLPIVSLLSVQDSRACLDNCCWPTGSRPQADPQHETVPTLQASVSSPPCKAWPQCHLWEHLPQLLSSHASLRPTAGD